MNNPRVRALLVCAGVLLSAAAALAQSSSGTIAGRVIDSSAAAIVGADVKLINQATDARTLKTSGDGTFVFTDVPPGAFSITVDVARV